MPGVVGRVAGNAGSRRGGGRSLGPGRHGGQLLCGRAAVTAMSGGRVSSLRRGRRPPSAARADGDRECPVSPQPAAGSAAGVLPVWRPAARRGLVGSRTNCGRGFTEALQAGLCVTRTTARSYFSSISSAVMPYLLQYCLAPAHRCRPGRGRRAAGPGRSANGAAPSGESGAGRRPGRRGWPPRPAGATAKSGRRRRRRGTVAVSGPACDARHPAHRPQRPRRSPGPRARSVPAQVARSSGARTARQHAPPAWLYAAGAGIMPG
jgi:hypothetical protein